MNVRRVVVSGFSRATIVTTLTPGRSGTSASNDIFWVRPVAVRPVEDLASADEDVRVEQPRVVARRAVHQRVRVARRELRLRDLERRRRVLHRVLET